MNISEVSSQAANGTSSAVEVLLATYNGERFLTEQIDSLVAQDYAPLYIIARDDGSTDGTREILRKYETRFPDRFRVLVTDKATGSAKSNFLKLMQAATAEYVCFADQDDVWLSDKVSSAMQAMRKLETRWARTTPLLVFTDLQVVDENLKVVHESFWKQDGIEPRRIRSLASILGHNVVTGCTALMNRRLLEMSLLMPEEATMHDAWSGLVALIFGAWEAIPEKTVLYRQHGRNVVGVAISPQSPFEKVRRFFQNEGRVRQWRLQERQAEELLRVYGESLPAHSRQLIEAYLRCGRSESRIERVSTMLRNGFYRSGLLRNVVTLTDLWRQRMGTDVPSVALETLYKKVDCQDGKSVQAER